MRFTMCPFVLRCDDSARGDRTTSDRGHIKKDGSNEIFRNNDTHMQNYLPPWHKLRASLLLHGYWALGTSNIALYVSLGSN